MTIRSEIIAEQLRQLISTAVRFELRDPELRDLTITRVKVSSDLQFADICFAGAAKREAKALAGLNRAKGAIKRYLGQNIQLRKMPELRFHPDQEAAAEQRIGALLQQLEIPPAKDGEAD
jgi:ribosome-binding factor A